jgi:hypothetical protein
MLGLSFQKCLGMLGLDLKERQVRVEAYVTPKSILNILWLIKVLILHLPSFSS